MAKQKSKKNFIVVVDHSGSMNSKLNHTPGSMLDYVCHGVKASKLGGQDVFFVGGGMVMKSRSNYFAAVPASAKEAREIIKQANVSDPKNAEVIFIDDGDISGHLDLKAVSGGRNVEFFKAFLDAGFKVHSIAVGGKVGQKMRVSLRPLKDMGISVQVISAFDVGVANAFKEKPSVARAINDIVSGKVKTPKVDNRPASIRDADRELEKRLEQLQGTQDNCERAIERAQERIERAQRQIKDSQEHIKFMRAELRTAKSEFNKVRKARDGLNGKVTRPKRTTAKKKAAPSRKR